MNGLTTASVAVVNSVSSSTRLLAYIEECNLDELDKTILTLRFIRGVSSYMENELCKKATGLTQFALYFLLPTMPQKVESMLDGLSDNLLFADLYHDDVYCLDDARVRAKEAIARSGGKLSVFGISFGESDIDTLYQHIAHS